MNGRYVPFETIGEFCARRLRELQQSPELGQFGKMGVSDFIKMIENEFYECADELMPPIEEPDRRGGSLLQ